MSTKLLESVHPGEILMEEFMVPLGLTSSSLSLALRVPASLIAEIVHGRRSISTDTALRLARYFETSPDLWLGLQTEYDLRMAERTIGSNISREVQPHAA